MVKLVGQNLRRNGIFARSQSVFPKGAINCKGKTSTITKEEVVRPYLTQWSRSTSLVLILSVACHPTMMSSTRPNIMLVASLPRMHTLPLNLGKPQTYPNGRPFPEITNQGSPKPSKWWPQGENEKVLQIGGDQMDPGTGEPWSPLWDPGWDPGTEKGH